MTGPAPATVPHTARVAIEQAIARGETLDWIVDNLRVQPRDVDQVLHGMDVAVRTADHALGLRRRPKRLPPPRATPAVRELSPCGTHAAYARHKARGEDVDEVCLYAEREYQAAKKRRHRSAA